MKFGIIGAGAVGGYYGALLAKHGFEVNFLLRSDYAHVLENGLMVESKDGNFTLEAVNAYCIAEDMPVCDVVIVALKTTQNHQLSTILPKVVKENGIVIALQNGLDIEKDISDIVPHATIIGGLCFLCSNKVGPGHIRHLDYGSIRFGQFAPDGQAAGITEELKMIYDVFTKASVPVHLADNLGKARWEKLVWNMGFNGLTVILNVTTDRIMNNEASLSLVKEIMFEVIKGANACGYDLEEKFVDLMITATRQMIDYSPSMKLDFEAGRPLEIDEIYWRPIHAAKKSGFDMHMSRVLAYELEFINRLNK